MDGSELVFIIMPIVIPLTLCLAVALPFVAGRPAGPSHPATHSRRTGGRREAEAVTPVGESASPATAPYGWQLPRRFPGAATGPVGRVPKNSSANANAGAR